MLLIDLCKLPFVPPNFGNHFISIRKTCNDDFHLMTLLGHSLSVDLKPLGFTARRKQHNNMQIKHIARGTLLTALILIGVVLYRSRSGSNMNVTPNSAEQIEKAKRR